MTTAVPKMTPMLQQYLEIKEQQKDAILFYRMGDFYEMFFDDAITASKVLGITLTTRNKKSDPVQVPMCGIPYHAVQTYLAKLIKAGHRVAICEQVEDPAEAKGIVKREVIKVVSPGVIADEQLLDDKSNNYLCALAIGRESDKNIVGLSFIDVSTGEFLTGEFDCSTEQGELNVLDQLSRMTPAEILISDQNNKLQDKIISQLQAILPAICVTSRNSDHFDLESTTALLYNHFAVLTLDGFGCGSFSSGTVAAGVLLDYVQETQKSPIDHIERLTPLDTQSILHIDESSRRNLELTLTISGNERKGSLLSVLDHTCTPMGARLLKSHILFPLQSRQRINARLDATSYFYNNSGSRAELRRLLSDVYDLERLNSRMILGSGNARDMLAIGNSLSALPEIRKILEQCDTSKLIEIKNSFDTLEDLQALLSRAIHPEPPVSLREGQLIKEGYNSELDELVILLRDGKKLILDLEAKERNATGLAKLKIGYNKVFGYFIEISKAQAEKAPEHYIRKQTLVNAERFITPELKEFESKVLGAQDRRVELEYNLFVELRNTLAQNSSRILATARLLAQLDFFTNNGEIAHRYNYIRPEISEDDTIHIIEGRHPVIERSLPAGKFVPNDLHLDQHQDEMLIITGPNMAGKSTILRQTALIVLMAQMGCYVPAQQANIGVVDRIFTRVGAMDNLRRGQSTFMVEMSETANILHNATERSLVILDEIGRGTSTYDGLSIAWAVAEDLISKNGKGVKTLFATHYHELIELARSNNRIQNYSIAVKEWKGNVIFLHKLIKGGTNRSYGVQVAALAGVPPLVVKRATQILQDIERGSFSPLQHQQTTSSKPANRKSNPAQLSLFAPPNNPLAEALDDIDPDTCSPIEALQHLYTLKKMKP